MSKTNTSIASFGFILFITLVSQTVLAQADYREFCDQTSKITQTGMLVLGGWALANMSTGAYGWSQRSGHQKYFHQMNFFWNTVNLSIAGFALYNNSLVDCSSLSPQAILAEHTRTENILLINSLLDVGYIGTGFLLKHLSPKYPARSDLLKGYGQSLILQGSFLMVFDLVLFGVLRDHRQSFPSNLNISLHPEFPGVHFSIVF